MIYNEELMDNEDRGSKRLELARAYIKLQPYRNLFCVEEAFSKGTIFKELYSPYHKKQKGLKGTCY